MNEDQKPSAPVTEIKSDTASRAEFMLLVLAMVLMPFLGFPVFSLHFSPFSIQDLALGLWLIAFLLLRLKALGGLSARPEPGNTGMQVLCGLGFALVLLCLSFLAERGLSLFWPVSSPPIPRGLEGAPAGLVILNLLVWAAWEELVFRVLLPGSIGAWGGRVLIQGIVSTLCFALFHAGGGPGPVLQALVCGSLLFVLWNRFKSPTVLIAAHSGFNLLVWLMGMLKISA